MGGGELGRRGETTKRPRNTTQARYSQVALSKIRLHYLPYFQSIFSWCGFVANFCFLPKYINPLFAVDVNNVGRCWQWHAPSLDWEQTARPSPISYLFRPVSHSPKIFFLISYLCRRIPHFPKIFFFDKQFYDRIFRTLHYVREALFAMERLQREHFSLIWKSET